MTIDHGLEVGVSASGLWASYQRGGLRLAVEKPWQGPLRAGLVYRASF